MHQQYVEPTVRVIWDTKESTGVVISESVQDNVFEYTILTAAHCVDIVGSSCIISLYNKYPMLGIVVKTDTEIDLALVSVTTTVDFCDPVSLAYRDAKIFEEVVVIGFPIGLGPIYTSGEISGHDKGLYFLNADVYYGNSGGPVFNEEGDLTGIVIGVIGDKGRPLFYMGVYVPISVINSFIS